MSDYRDAVKKLIDAEMENVIEEEMRKATEELLEEQRKTIREVVEEQKQIIREVVNQEKEAVRARVEERIAELRMSISRIGLKQRIVSGEQKK